MQIKQRFPLNYKNASFRNEKEPEFDNFLVMFFVSR